MKGSRNKLRFFLMFIWVVSFVGMVGEGLANPYPWQPYPFYPTWQAFPVYPAYSAYSAYPAYPAYPAYSSYQAYPARQPNPMFPPWMAGYPGRSYPSSSPQWQIKGRGYASNGNRVSMSFCLGSSPRGGNFAGFAPPPPQNRFSQWGAPRY